MSTLRESIQSFLQRREPEHLGLLRRLVSVNSFTTNRPGVEATAKLTAEAFAPLGFTAEHVPSVNANYGAHLVLTRRGRSGRKLGLISHLDTVFPPEEEARNDFHWRRDGDRIFGPGTMDIKGGTVMMHMVLSALNEAAPDRFEEPDWVLLFNSSEEVLSDDFGKLCLERLGEEALAALVFEAGGRVGDCFSIVTARKGRATFLVEVEGRGAHAGGHHHRGANAIVQLAEVIQQIASLTDYSRDLTCNVGTAAGGTVVNRVPHFATAEVEMRAFTVEAYQAGAKAILALDGRSSVRSFEGNHPCHVRVRLMTETPPWPPNPGSERLYEIWKKTGTELGLKVVREERGGLSDGNHLWHRLPTLDGLGPYGDNAHCSEQSADGSKEAEYVDAGSFVPKGTLNVLSILRLLGD